MHRVALIAAVGVLLVASLAFVGFLSLALTISAGEPLARQASADGGASGPATPAKSSGPACRLEIEGQRIEKLMLLTPGGDIQTLVRPGAAISLPAGNYRLSSVELQGGFQAYGLDPATGKFTLTPEEPYRLRVGAPLRPEVRVVRWGRCLELNYALNDAAGRNYQPTTRETRKPPRFAIYSDERQVGSGNFEYG